MSGGAAQVKRAATIVASLASALGLGAAVTEVTAAATAALAVAGPYIAVFVAVGAAIGAWVKRIKAQWAKRDECESIVLASLCLEAFRQGAPPNRNIDTPRQCWANKWQTRTPGRGSFRPAPGVYVRFDVPRRAKPTWLGETTGAPIFPWGGPWAMQWDGRLRMPGAAPTLSGNAVTASAVCVEGGRAMLERPTPATKKAAARAAVRVATILRLKASGARTILGQPAAYWTAPDGEAERLLVFLRDAAGWGSKGAG